MAMSGSRTNQTLTESGQEKRGSNRHIPQKNPYLVSGDFLAGIALDSSPTEAVIYRQSIVAIYISGLWSEFRGGARTSPAHSSESSFLACRALQQDLEEAKRIR